MPIKRPYGERLGGRLNSELAALAGAFPRSIWRYFKS